MLSKVLPGPKYCRKPQFQPSETELFAFLLIRLPVVSMIEYGHGHIFVGYLVGGQVTHWIFCIGTCHFQDQAGLSYQILNASPHMTLTGSACVCAGY